ncbi:ABC transporter permease [Nevskia soli]|uniref:ABC transporter permease n=1 Tax=Nevskia soli TaxID=418856 RepID=UPI0004A6DE06|nr:ABC transporter permease [Nevskia soli]
MRALDRKLLRDAWRLRGQLLAISLVMASGVATFVLSRTTVDSLRLTQETFYRDSRFADVFVSLKRAPEAVAQQMREVPGVAQVDTRVAAAALLDMPDLTDPVSALVLSLPEAAGLNRLYLRAGRLPEDERETAVNEAFAEAHQLRPGDPLTATINGRRKTLVVTGIALSPEFVYLIRPGDVMPDFKRYGVLWMPRKAVEAAQGMQGAFNDAVLRLELGTVPQQVVDTLDGMLGRWGSAGAILRPDQTSHRYLSDELRQLDTQARVVPLIFLGVAAFLLNLVLSRLLAHERTQIAILKAFGYGTWRVARHYLQLVALVVLVGAVLGLWAGAELGSGLASMYSHFFRYPFLRFRFEPAVGAAAVLVSGAAAFGGTLFAVLRAAALPPAVGMRPQAQPAYRRTVLDWSAVRRLLSASVRMILRNILRRPMKSGLTATGIAMACAILMIGGFMEDAINAILDVQFRQALRADLTVTFTDVMPESSMHELAHLPGVRAVEPIRAVPVRLRSEHRSERLAVQGLAADGSLLRLLSSDYRVQALPDRGLMLTDYLADSLGVRQGQAVQVEVLQGSRPAGNWTVAGLVHDLTGYSAYTSLPLLNAWLKEGHAVSGAFLQVDAGALDEVYAALKGRPRVAGVMNRRVALDSFKDTMGQNILIYNAVNLVLAAVIAVGVIYNGMRTTLSERERELASLRVLGFTQGEAGALLVGEIVLLTLAAIPLGLALGHALCAYLAEALASDLYRIPLVIGLRTYARAAAVVAGTTVVCAVYILRSVGRLDLVTALKMAE